MKNLILLLLISLVLSFTQKAPFTISDLYKIKNVGEAQVSPDGKFVAYTVTEYDLPNQKQVTNIWLYDVEKKESRQMTRNEAPDYHPRWSPDGSELLFISYRDESAQVWILPFSGGESRQLTHFYPGINSPEWTANGKGIIFTSHVFPEAGADQEMNKELDSQLSDGPVKAHYADGLLYRHWTSYRDWKYNHLFHFDIASGEYKELTSGKLDAPAYAQGFDLSPDGKYAVFSVKDVPDPATSTNNDIWLLNLETMELNNITPENKAFDGNPGFSPDSRFIAYLTQKVPGYEADKFRLAVYDIQAKSARILTEDIDNWVDDLSWSPEGSSIFFKVQEEGYFPYYKVDAKRGDFDKIISLTSTRGMSISPNGAYIYTVKSAIAEPAELYEVPLGIGKKQLKPVRLTFFNKKIEDEVDIRPAEKHWIKSPTGKNIHTFIIRPHNFDPDKKYPVIINVHGGPQMQWSESFRGDWQVYPGADYVLAFPNPHGSTGYGQDFTEGISKDWGGKVHRDILAVAEYVGKLPYTDEKRMGAMGWSWGGYYMMWLEGNEHPFKTLASMMGVYNLEAMWGATEELWFPEWEMGGTPYESDLHRKWSPHLLMDKFKTPCLVITGEKDYRVPYTQSLEFFTALQRKGIESELIVFTNDGHWPNYLKSMPVYYNAHLEWFNKYLGGAKAPWDTKKLIRNQVFK